MSIQQPRTLYQHRLFPFLLALSLLSPIFASSGTWATKASIPTKRYMFVSETVNNKIYVIGGYDGAYYTKNEEYDPVTDSWSTKASMSQAREGAASGVVNGKIYVIGGNTTTHKRNVEEYDPGTDTWTVKTPLSMDLEQAASAAVNNKIYVIGGWNGSNVLNTVWEYNPTADSWTAKNPMPTARNYIKASVVDGKIYVMGGGNGITALSTVEVYDPVADSWTTKTSMPVARHSGLNIAANGKIYYIGGSTFSTEVLEYDPVSDTWTNCGGTCTPMPTGRMFLNGNLVGGKIYAISGQIEGGSYTMTTVVEAYTPPSSLVAYYPFNGNANDESGNGNHGTVYGASLAADRFGKADSAYSLDGVNDYISIPNLAPIQNTPIDQFSFQAWMKSASGDGVTPQNVFEIHTQAPSGNKEVYFEANMPGAMRFGITDNGGGDHQVASQTLALDTWYHVVGTYDGAKQRLYINGLPSDSLAWSGQMTLTGAAALGKDLEGGQQFNGLLDDIRIYDRALSGAEIDSLYHLGGWPPHADFTPITTGPVVSDGGYSHGSAWGDYDNDGDLDLFVANSGNQNNFLYANNGDGSYTKVTTGPVVSDGGYSRGGSWGDYDNDGDLDLFVANSDNQNNFLYANNGDGSYTKVTTGPVVSDGGDSFGASWGDYDNDGDLDLFVANQNQDNFLYTNNGDGSFAKVTTGPLVSDGGYSMGCSWGDYDSDGDLDLLVANHYGENNFLYTNNGDGTFTSVTTGPVVTDGGNSRSVSWGDYDNDGDLDLFVANSGGQNNFLYTNNGDGGFTSITTGPAVTDGGNSVGSAWGDFDNDGDLDLFVSNSSAQNNFLYANNGDGTFTAVTTGPVVSDAGESMGSIGGDYDNDGDLDFFVANSGEDNFLYTNNGNTNHWINLQLVGTQSNVSAIGSKVRLGATISGAPVWQLNELSGQTGFGGQNSLNAEFGLGGATIIDSIRIEWPSGIVWDTTDVAVDQFLTITEHETVTASTQHVTGTGEVTFPGTDITMNFTSQSGTDTIEVQAFPTAPSGSPPTGTVLAADRYWIITHTGSGDFSVELTLNLGPGAFTTREQQYPARLCLLQRDTGGTLPWEIESSGTSATDSTVTFTGITGFSQFAIGRSTDNEGPSISSEFRRVARPDDLIEVDASVSDPSGIRSMRLHYLEGSSLDFDQTDMNELNDTTYRAGIPVASPVIRGLAYFIVGTDSVGNVTITDTTSVPVDFTAGTFNTSMSGTAFSDGFPFNKWRLISVPCDINETSVDSIIQAELGEDPSNDTWKIFRYVGPGPDDYQAASSFTSGESYFLKQIVTEGPLHFTLGDGQSVNHTGWTVTIAPLSWRFVASPYPFPVSVTADQGVFEGPYTYGAFGTRNQEGWSLGQVKTTFRPWGGYIIYNNTDLIQTLEIKPPGLAKAILAKGDDALPKGWLAHITVEGERFFDSGNTIGRLEGALEGRDHYDTPEPPLLDECISLTIERPDWETGTPFFTSDVRALDETNGVWDLDLLTRGESGPIAITYEIRGEVPSGIQVVLLDLLRRQAYDLTASEQPEAIIDYSERLPYHLKVIAGTPDFVQGAVEEALSRLPEEFALSQNYPNPFNPSTTIEYALPKPARVSLRVYNLLGQEIATLVNDWQDMGYYEIVWQGHDRAGRSVASGVYFAILHADKQILSRKMVLLK